MRVRIARIQQRGGRLAPKCLGATAIDIERIAQAAIAGRVNLEYRAKLVAMLEGLGPLVLMSLPVVVRATSVTGWRWRRIGVRIAVVVMLLQSGGGMISVTVAEAGVGRTVCSARERTHGRRRIRGRVGQARGLRERRRLTRSQRAARQDVAELVIVQRQARERRSAVGEHVRVRHLLIRRATMGRNRGTAVCAACGSCRT